MSYNSGKGMPFENASKLGHLVVTNSSYIKELLADFEDSQVEANKLLGGWKELISTNITFKDIWVVDGSYQAIKSSMKPHKELAFIKTAMVNLNLKNLQKVDSLFPHPTEIKEIMNKSVSYHSTVLPLKNIKSSIGNNLMAIRTIIYDSIREQNGGEFFETLKWLAYEKWNKINGDSPEFTCPYCGTKQCFSNNQEKKECHCNHELYLTDMLGFHHEMTEDKAPESLVSAYMSIMEHLMLFTAIRVFWDEGREALKDILFIKDGPLSLNSQYVKLIPPIRNFLDFAKDEGYPVSIIGQEKSGKFVDHLSSIVQEVNPKEYGQAMRYSVLTHEFVSKEVQMSITKTNYGFRTNWGEKVYIKFDPKRFIVINVPTGEYIDESFAPKDSDLINLNKILNTLPQIISNQFDNALYPIEVANRVASLSNYPSVSILEQFMEKYSKKNK